jgi:iron complex outermembrane receptor protein
LPVTNVERVDFVMGPSSATYGNASPAGAVNTITKTPFFGKANSVTFSAGSWSSVRGTGDFNWSSDDVAVRLNIASDKANSFIDYEKPKNTLIAPSFL